MKTSIKTILYTLPLLMAGACDTTEDAFWAGPQPENVLSVENGRIYLNADGTAKDVNVNAICYWDARLTSNDGVFKISKTDGKGDGVITVSADPNYNKEVGSTSIVIKAREFSDVVKVGVMQATLTFEMEDKKYPVMVEEGGDIYLKFNSTTAWELAVRENPDSKTVGSLDWFEFTPGISGEGDYYEVEVEAHWEPNYTLEEREITLVLTPQKQKIMDYLTTELPQPFTLKQEAGTLPTDVFAEAASVDMHEAVCRVAYESKSPVTDCGVRLRDRQTGETFAARATAPEGGFPLGGVVDVNVYGLEPSHTYEFVPVVTNMVGTTEGSYYTTFTTLDDPDAVVYYGVQVLNFYIEPEAYSAVAVVETRQDLPLEINRLTIVGPGGDEIRLIGEEVDSSQMEDTTIVRYVYQTGDVLTPKTVYEAVLECVSPSVPAGTVVYPWDVRQIEFTTRGLVPSEPDNDTPDVE